MSTDKAESIVWTCDGCGKVEITLANEEAPYGFHFSSLGLVHAGGGDAANDVWACKTSCIRSAVINAFDRENNS